MDSAVVRQPVADRAKRGEEPPGRLAAIMPAEGVSGPGRQLAGLVRELTRHAWDSKVFVLWREGHARPPYADFLEQQGIDYELVVDRGPVDLGLVRRLAQRLRDWQPHIVQTHGYKASAAAVLMRPGSSWHWVGCYHGATAESRRATAYHRVDRLMLARADRVVVMSNAQAALFRRGARVTVIHNAVIPLARSSETDREAIRATVADLPRPLIAFVGRLSHEKGGDVLVEALKVLHRGGFTAGLAIAGTGPEEPRWKSLVNERELSNFVRFLGDVRAVDALYEESSLVALPSRSEGLPNVLLEALHAGKPVVATRVGAVPDVIVNDDIGLLVEPNDVEGLAAAIQRSVDLGRKPSAALAREKVVDAFSVERRAARHVELYQEILAGAGAVSA